MITVNELASSVINVDEHDVFNSILISYTMISSLCISLSRNLNVFSFDFLMQLINLLQLVHARMNMVFQF